MASPARPILLLLLALPNGGCPSLPVTPAGEVAPQPARVPTVEVTKKCEQAILRQVERAGFALVITADDVLTGEQLELLNSLYRKLHGIPGVSSVRSIADEQVITASELELSAEPFITEGGFEDRNFRLGRYQMFGRLINPALLSADLRATALVVKLHPTSQQNARVDVRRKILDLAYAVPEKIKAYLVEYPVAAAESMAWPTSQARQGLEVLNRKLGGSGVLEVEVSCQDADCLLTPIHLAAIERFQRIVEAMPRVRATRSMVNAIRIIQRCRTGRSQLPATADEALGALALLDRSTGICLYADESFRRGEVRIYFDSGNADEYCRLGQALKRAAEESSLGSLRFQVMQPGRDGF